MLYLSLLLFFNVCVPLKADPLNCTFPQTQKAWAHCISLAFHTLHRQDGRAQFKRYKSLKRKKKKTPQKKTGKRLPFRTRSPAAHKQKSLMPVSVTALIQAQTQQPRTSQHPVLTGEPWRWRGFPMLHQHREALLSTALFCMTVYVFTTNAYIYCDYGVWCRLFLDRNLWQFLFLSADTTKKKKKKKAIFFFSDLMEGGGGGVNWYLIDWKLRLRARYARSGSGDTSTSSYCLISLLSKSPTQLVDFSLSLFFFFLTTIVLKSKHIKKEKHWR